MYTYRSKQYMGNSLQIISQFTYEILLDISAICGNNNRVTNIVGENWRIQPTYLYVYQPQRLFWSINSCYWNHCTHILNNWIRKVCHAIFHNIEHIIYVISTFHSIIIYASWCDIMSMQNKYFYLFANKFLYFELIASNH